MQRSLRKFSYKKAVRLRYAESPAAGEPRIWPFCEREFFRLSGETFDRIELSCCNVHGRGGSDGIQFLRTLKRLKFIGRFESEFFPHPVGHRESVIEGSSGVFSPECSVEFLHPVFDPASCVHSDNLF